MHLNLIKEKAFYKSLLTIAIPIGIQNLITLATSMMDTLMLGRADNTGTLLSASSLANQPFFILSLTCFGLAGAGSVLSAQYWGKRDIKSIRSVFSLIIKISTLFAVLFGLAVLIFPEFIMGLYSNNAEIIAAGAKYLRIIGYAYFLFGISNTLVCLLRSIEVVKIAVVVNISSFCTNVFLNWVLIFGNLGAPAMGIEGAAIATLAARTLEFIIVMTYMFVIDKKLKFRLRHLAGFNRMLARDLFSFGAPVLINEVMWSIAVSLQAAILGHINYASGDPVAANAITGMVQQLSTTFIMGLSSAAAVIVGKSVGENRLDRARAQAQTLYILSFVIGIAASVFITLTKDIVIGFYKIPEETKLLASDMMIATAVITIFVSASSISIVGVLRGGGDTKFCLWAELLALWCVATPLAFSASYFFQLPVVAVYICMKSDEIIKVTACGIRIFRNKWIKNLTR